jgi:replication factor C subunit 3/5
MKQSMKIDRVRVFVLANPLCCCAAQPNSKGYKLIILDEADQMTRVAQFALRRGIPSLIHSFIHTRLSFTDHTWICMRVNIVIEKFAANARFCILANYINKIIPALQSRCTRFRFGPLDKSQIRTKLDVIAKKEK